MTKVWRHNRHFAAAPAAGRVGGRPALLAAANAAYAASGLLAAIWGVAWRECSHSGARAPMS